MNFWVNLKTKRTVLFAVLVAVLSLIIMIASGLVTGIIGMMLGFEYYTLVLLQEAVAIVFIVWLAHASKTSYTLTTRGAGLGHSLQVGAYPAVFICIVAASMGVMGAESGRPLQTPVQIIIYFLSMLGIGMAEEFAFRGIIAESLIAHYGSNYRGAWKATIVSGVIFGLVHMSNAFGASVFGVLIQAAVASVLGMLFSAIYYRTGNLWVCVLLHAGIDAASLLESGLYGSGTIEQMVSSYTLANLMPCITYGIPVLFLLRRSKNNEVQFWFARGAEIPVEKVEE